jgi:glycosyltransferase involved in cell wall biosynthesis
LLDAQTLDFDFEIIIIDDGSTDGTDGAINEWLEEFATPQIFYQSRSNMGLCGTLNELINISCGEVIRLCSSDDQVVFGSTRSMLDKLLDAQYDCVVADGQIISDSDELLYESSILYHGGAIGKMRVADDVGSILISHWCIAGPSSLIRRSVYSDFSYASGLSIDDFDFYLSMINSNARIGFVDIVSCRYRLHNNNTSKTANTEARIKNLTSFLVSCNRYDSASFKHRKELQLLIVLTNAKICFLKNEFPRLGFFLVQYLLRRIC